MKIKLTTLFTALILIAGMTAANAQLSEECTTTGSVFNEAAKVKNWEVARPHFEKLRKECPTWSLALYQRGEQLLKADIKKATGQEKIAAAEDLVLLLKQREQYFPAKTPHGKNIAEQAQILFDNKIGTKKTEFDLFQEAFSSDEESISSAKNIYTRFKLAVDLYKEGELPLQDVFDLYDETQTKLNKESTKLDAKLQKLTDKEEAGQQLSAKEAKRVKAYTTNLKAFAIFAGSTDAALQDLGNCSNLIPFYQKDFDAMKNDIEWIRKAAGRLAGKDCTDSSLFQNLVGELHRLEPSARTARYLGLIAQRKGDEAGAERYFLESVRLETDPLERAKSNFALAETARKKGSSGKARGLYQKALVDNPSMGRCYLRIAAMYAASANNCGSNVFDKRAVYWLAATTAERAGRVSPSLAKIANGTAASYRGKAPDKAMIFSGNKGGTTVKIGCWIGSSVRVPNL